MGKGSREGGTIGLPLHVAESLVEAPLRVVGAPAGTAADSSTAAAHRRRSLPGSGNRAHAQAQGIGRLSSFAHALHARPQSIAETRGVAARARLPPGCPAVRSILLLRLSPTNGARAKGKGHGPKQSLLQQPTQTPPAPPRVARGPHAAPAAP